MKTLCDLHVSAGMCLFLLVIGLTGCSQRDTANAPSAPGAAASEQELVVFAATSLREAFTHMKGEFLRAHPNTGVVFNFAGSQELRTQIEHGAPVDVFASADTKHMNALLDASRVRTPALFARNEPVMVVSSESARMLRAFADLPNAERIVFGTPDVPIGRYTAQILKNAAATLGADFAGGVRAKVVSEELNVRQVLAKVALGEADAAIVYRTDTYATDNPVSVVTIPLEFNVIAQYPIAVVREAPHAGLAEAWVAFVQSETGQAALEAAGFLVRPSATPPP